MFTICDLLDSLRTAIEAVAVTDPASEDDRFRCFTPTAQVSRGSRATLVSASTPSPIRPGRTCFEYQTTITLITAYATGAPEAGQRSPFERALLDCENVTDAISAWAALTDGVLSHEQSEGSVDDNGDGWIAAERTITVRYNRGA
jgi:hypothetical protein